MKNITNIITTLVANVFHFSDIKYCCFGKRNEFINSFSHDVITNKWALIRNILKVNSIFAGVSYK